MTTSNRPVSLTVFGILNIGFALFGFVLLLVGFVVQHMNLGHTGAGNSLELSPLLQAINVVFGVLGGIILIVSGIGLFYAREWARLTSIVYAVMDILMVFVGAVLSYPLVSRLSGPTRLFAIVGLVFGICFELIYPILLLIFMTRPKIVAACRQTPAPPPPPPA